MRSGHTEQSSLRSRFWRQPEPDGLDRRGKSAGEFLLSNGAGGPYRYRVTDRELILLPLARGKGTLWDNHIAGLG